MPVDIFTKPEFEGALPVDKNTGDVLWQLLDLVRGEHTYTIPVTGTNKRIVVRSSVKQNETSASCGKDSIRLWVEYHYKDEWWALGKLDAHTKRTKNWRENMKDKLRRLYRMALEDSKCMSTAQNAEQRREQQANGMAQNASGNVQNALLNSTSIGENAGTNERQLKNQTSESPALVCPYFGLEVPDQFEECKECKVAKECYQEYDNRLDYESREEEALR